MDAQEPDAQTTNGGVHPPAPDLTGYPWDLVEVAYLDDGTEIEIRPIRPDDGPRIERLFYRLSPESLYRRFFAPMTRPDRRMVARLVEVDYVDRLALTAVVDDEIIGVARFDRLAAVAPPQLDVDPGLAEAAVIVDDAWQGRGIGTRLLWRLTAAARQRGVHSFTAEVLASNRPMLGLLHVLSPEVETSLVGGTYSVVLPLSEVAAHD